MDWIFSWWTVFGLSGLLAGGTALAFFLGFGPVIIAFLSTKLGRWIALIGAGILGVLFLAAKVFAMGRQKERDQLKANSERKEQQRDALDAALKNLPPDKLVDRARPWLRDDK